MSKALSLLACPECYNTSSLKLTDVADKKKRLSSYLKVYCDDCTFFHKFYTSPAATSNNYIRRGGNTMEINARALYGTWSIGIGFSLLSMLCGFLNMSPPLTQTSYDNMSNIIKAASKSVAEKIMSDAQQLAYAKVKKLLMLVCQSTVRGNEKDFNQLLV